MKSLQSVDRQRLVWKQPKFGARTFDLLAGEDLVGTLDWSKLLSDRAIARSADHKWYLDRVGFLRQRIVAAEADSGNMLAQFEFDWRRDGTLTLASGQALQWYRTKVFRTYWALVDENDRCLIEVQAGTNWFKHEADILLHPAAESLPALEPLIFMVWYVAYMSIQDAAAIAAVM